MVLPALSLTASAVIFDESGRTLLIKENYGRRRSGPPGGSVEPNESPSDAAIREVMEETGAHVRLEHLIGMFRFRGAAEFLAYIFLGVIGDGAPRMPETGEIAEIGWFDPNDLPAPLIYAASHVIAAALRGERGVVEDIVLKTP